MISVSPEAKGFHLRVCNLDSRFVIVGVEHCLDPKPALRGRGADQVHYRLIVDQRLPFPGETDEREQPVFDFVPLARSRRIMTDCDRDSEFVRKRL
jgi:hypothetical protein